MISMMSGPPFSVFADDTSLNLPGSSQTADQVKPVVKLGGTGSGNPYYDPASFADVNEARFGNTGYNILRAPGRVQLGLRADARVPHHLRRQTAVQAWRRSTSRTRRTSAIPDNTVGDGEDFMTITSVQDLAREGIDERQFRLGFRLVF